MRQVAPWGRPVQVGVLGSAKVLRQEHHQNVKGDQGWGRVRSGGVVAAGVGGRMGSHHGGPCWPSQALAFILCRTVGH